MQDDEVDALMKPKQNRLAKIEPIASPRKEEREYSLEEIDALELDDNGKAILVRERLVKLHRRYLGKVTHPSGKDVAFALAMINRQGSVIAQLTQALNEQEAVLQRMQTALQQMQNDQPRILAPSAREFALIKKGP